MPGRTEYEAVVAFLQPLRDAVSVLTGHSQIVCSQSGGYRKGQDYAWALNPLGGGKLIPGVGTFSAEMKFEIVDCDPARHEGRYRVTTRAYRYKLTGEDGEDLWLIHWHPKGDSPYKEPHQHIPPDLSRHLPTGRITFEKVIAWCIEYGAETRGSKDEALAQLDLCQAAHLLFRSWTDSPKQAEAAQQ